MNTKYKNGNKQIKITITLTEAEHEAILELTHQFGTIKTRVIKQIMEQNQLYMNIVAKKQAEIYERKMRKLQEIHNRNNDIANESSVQ